MKGWQCRLPTRCGRCHEFAEGESGYWSASVRLPLGRLKVPSSYVFILLRHRHIYSNAQFSNRAAACLQMHTDPWLVIVHIYTRFLASQIACVQYHAEHDVNSSELIDHSVKAYSTDFPDSHWQLCTKHAIISVLASFLSTRR